MPVLETPQGALTESSAIARYLASLGSRKSLYPQPVDSLDATRALVDAWIDWAIDLDKATTNWIEPMLGQGPYLAAAVEAAKSDFDAALQTLEKHLTSSTFLVGDNLTLADIVVVSHLLLLYLTVRPRLQHVTVAAVSPHLHTGFRRCNHELARTFALTAKETIPDHVHVGHQCVIE